MVKLQLEVGIIVDVMVCLFCVMVRVRLDAWFIFRVTVTLQSVRVPTIQR